VWGWIENETLMRFDDFIHARMVTKVDAHKKLGIGKGEVC